MSYQQPYGYPPQPRKRTNPWLIGCLVALGVGVLIVGGCTVLVGVAANKAAHSTIAPPVIDSPPPTSTGKAAKQTAPTGHLGTPAQANGVELTGLQVLDNPPKGALTGTVQGHLWAIKVKVKNAGDKPLTVNPLYFKLIGDDDQEYPLDLAAVDGQIDTSDVAPGLATSGLVAFDIPKGVKPSRIVFTNEIMSDLVTAGLG